jgi:predicted alpha/beta-fold hydrolase
MIPLRNELTDRRSKREAHGLQLPAQRLVSRAVTTNGSTDFLAHWAAHAWTILPNFVSSRRERHAPLAEPWSTTLQDEVTGCINLRGELRRESGPFASHCLVVVHGLGGSSDRHYCIRAAHAAQRAGVSCLRFGLRGADRQGDDFYHAGLAVDVDAAVSSAALADFEHIYVLGYSLGGHVTLRYALQRRDPRVRAVAAVCAPLDLELSALNIDAPESYVYRRHVLQGLNEIYGAVATRHAVPTPLARVTQARGIRVWDSLTVVPRYGFGTVDNYYASMSVGPRLSELTVPSLLVQSSVDPMVPPWTYERHLTRELPRLEVRRLQTGGHVAFPRVRAANGAGKVSVEDQILTWFTAH